jgi:predicted ATPase
VTGRERIAFHIVTGFLGAGKTMLINHLLRAPDLADALARIRRPSRDGRGQTGFRTL